MGRRSCFMTGLALFFLGVFLSGNVMAQYQGIWKDDVSEHAHNFYIQHYATGSTIVVYTQDARTFYAFVSDMADEEFDAYSMDPARSKRLNIAFLSDESGTATITDNSESSPQPVQVAIRKEFNAIRTQHSGIWKDPSNSVNIYLQEYETGSTIVVFTFDGLNYQAFLGAVDEASLEANNVADQSEVMTLDFSDISAAYVQVSSSDISSAAIPNGGFSYDILKKFPPPEFDYCFTANPRYGTAPLEVQFQDVSLQPASSWTWFFGDGETSGEKNPVHTYAQPGTYSVSLGLSCQDGFLLLVTSDYIHVFETWDPVISGTITVAEGGTGLPYAGVDFSNGGGSCTADGEGYYVHQTSDGWNGTATPSSTGYIFDPADRTYVYVTSDKPGDDYVATGVETVNISGRVTTPGGGAEDVTITLSNGAGNAVTDFNGYYNVQVPKGWSGTVTPYAENVVFEPSQRVFSQVDSNQADQNFLVYVQIAGLIIKGDVTQPCGESRFSTPVSGVTVVAVQGSDTWTALTNASGAYDLRVPFGFTGVATPEKEGWVFSPEQRQYTNISSNVSSDQLSDGINFVGVVYEPFPVSGRVTDAGVGLAGVTVEFDNSGGTALTDGDGYYSMEMDPLWGGHITPSLEGYTFVPLFATLDPYLSCDSTHVDFVVTPEAEVTISGYVRTESGAPLGGVVLDFGSAGETQTFFSGAYSKAVPVGWSGTVTASKSGYTFSPTSKTFSNVTTHQTQDFLGMPTTVTISGVVGTSSGSPMSGVGLTFSGSDGTVTTTTDVSGHYSRAVTYGWSGTVTASKSGYTFSPTSKTFSNVTADQTQNFTGTAQSVLISGTVSRSSDGAPLSGVSVSYTGGSTTTDSSGYYFFQAASGWSGTVTPSKGGYTFSPASKTFSNVTTDQTQNFVGTALKIAVSGNVYQNEGGYGSSGVVGVTVSYTGGTTTTNSSGDYSFEVNSGWSGTVTPSKAGYDFDPSSRSYSNITSNQTHQNYVGTAQTFTISGTITASPGSQPLFDTTVSYSGGSTTTNSSGYYSFDVSYGWSGTVTPSRIGFSFNPPSRSYSNVTSNKTSQDFGAELDMVNVTGTITSSTNGQPMVGVAVNSTGSGWMPSTTTDASGNYLLILAAGTDAVVTPSKAGTTFSPPSRSYTNLTSGQSGQNFVGIPDIE